MSILALTSDTLIGTAAAGNIEYNGQFFGTDSNASRAQLQRIVQETAQATTSGTSKDFTGIPAWVKKITVMFNGVSLSGTSSFLIQIGAGSIDATSYISQSVFSSVAVTTSGVTSTTGFGIFAGNANSAFSGHNIITNISGNTWISSANMSTSVNTAIVTGAGNKTLGGTLDRVRITTVNGTDTFDAGSVNIIYEG